MILKLFKFPFDRLVGFYMCQCSGDLHRPKVNRMGYSICNASLFNENNFLQQLLLTLHHELTGTDVGDKSGDYLKSRIMSFVDDYNCRFNSD